MVTGKCTIKDFAVIVAATAGNLGIGKNGTIPWNLSGDLKYFLNVTSNCEVDGKNNAVIMGRKTWESIPEIRRPLSNRINVVISRNIHLRNDLSKIDRVLAAASFIEALQALSEDEIAKKVDQIFVIGGEKIYEEAMKYHQCKKIYMTKIENGDFECDTFFPEFRTKYILKDEGEKRVENGLHYSFQLYEKKLINGVNDHNTVEKLSNGPMIERNVELSNARSKYAATSNDKYDNIEEKQYLSLVGEILDRGAERGDRTGTGTLSKFGVQMRYSLRDGKFPLLTTKKVFWRGIVEELLWFISGSTNANILKKKNIHIWDGNGSREFLDNRGLSHREEGDLGPVYGFQWRHFGAKYIDMHTDYSGQGIDQLADCIKKIKETPDDRRIIMSAWNPTDLELMALPPCHMFCQFYVANGELSCQMYQRSADMGLGVPFNIASYSLLTCMVAHVCGLKAGDFVHTIGDAHVYLNHVDALRQQLKRDPRPFPTLEINGQRKDIDSFKFGDFELRDYNPMGPIKMKMAV